MKLSWTRAGITLAVGLGLTALASAGVVTPEERSDLDGSGVVDAADLRIVAADLGNSVPPADPLADLDGNGEVNVVDLSMVAVLLGRQTGIFPDANLEAAVREALGLPEGDITPQDLQGLTELVAPERGIEDLTGLEGLSLDVNQISDLASLSGLTNLFDLYLFGNQVSDLTPLSSLTNLGFLVLDGNQISDVTPLSGLTNLGWLLLSSNKISDLIPLSGLTNLGALVLGRNQISYLTPLSGLTNLWLLWLSDNQVSDLQPLVDNEGFGEGDWVDVSFNPLSEESLDVHIPALEAWGVDVDHD